MEKDITIINLIKNLKTQINFDKIEIVDYWNADLCAIGLKNLNRLIYISTLEYQGDNKKYDYDLELLDEKDGEKIQVVKKGRKVSEPELVDEIKSFLHV